jgi:hypothetical protein
MLRLTIALPDRLPHLEGRRGAILRAVYLAVAAATLVVIAGSFWFNARDYFGNMPTTVAYGFRTETNADSTPVVGGAALGLGLRREDRILSINGQELQASATEYTIADRLAAADDGRVTLVTRSEDGAVRAHHLTRAPVTTDTIDPNSQLPFWTYVTLAFAFTQLPLLIWLAASLLLARQRPRDPEAMLFAFSFLLMSLSIAGFWLTALLGVPQLLRNSFGGVGVCLLLIAIAGFPDGRFDSLVSRVAATGLVLLSIILCVANAANLTVALAAPFLLCTIAVLAAAWLRYRRTPPGIARQQMKWAVFGFCAALALVLPGQILFSMDALGTNGMVPFLIDGIVIPFAMMLIPIGLLVSLLRYRLYDAETVVSRSAGYAVLTVLLAATFAAFAKGMEIFFESSFGREAGALPGAIGAGLAVVLITPLNNHIQNWAERRFQKALLHLRRDLPDCVGDLRETAGMDELLDEVLARVEAGTRAVRSAVVIAGETVAARGGDGDFPIRVPLRIGHQQTEIGTLLVGPRPDGSRPGKDEVEALDEIADPIARAMRIVLLREAREVRDEARHRRHETRFAAVEEAVARFLGPAGGRAAGC